MPGILPGKEHEQAGNKRGEAEDEAQSDDPHRHHGEVIQWPISARFVSPTGTGPRNFPRAMTMTRSARSQTSERSADRSRMATPLARSATSRFRIITTVRISRPRVG